jgi:hypothetical protein
MIIGIHGKAGSGKDTIGQMIIESDPESNWHRKAFADKIKVISAEILALDPKLVFSDSFKQVEIPRLQMTGRDFLQKFGTDMCRKHLSEDIWLNALLDEYSPDKNWVITDVRFRNEANRIKELGGKLIKVTRDTDELSHISERDLETYHFWDQVIDNNSTIDDLRTIVENDTCKLFTST